MSTEQRLCECGCGEAVASGSRFRRGHASRMRGRPSPGTKRCPACGEVKPATGEYFVTSKDRRDGLHAYCKPCHVKKGVAWVAEHRDQRRAYDRAQARKWRALNPDRTRPVQARAYLKLKNEVMQAYGGQCTCCGETELAFLTIEHIRHDGAAHRQAVGSSDAIYRDLRKRGYPKDGYTVLCWNCNMATARGGICPHKYSVIVLDATVTTDVT
jgi:hypothetical protein